MDFALILKGNPNHGPDGRFSSAAGGLGEAKTYVGMMYKLRGPQQEKAGVWSTDKFMLDHMQEYGNVQKGNPKMAQHECYNNSAIRAAVENEDVVDGYVNVHGVQIRHSWNLDKDGKPVDHTIEDPERWTYVGVKFPASVVAEVSQSKYWNHAEGITGALQKMPEKTRNKYLKESGYAG